MSDDLELRSGYHELDDKTDELRDLMTTYQEPRRAFTERLHVSWIYHEQALDGVVLTYHEIKAALGDKVISDVSLVPTYHEIKSHKRAIDQLLRQASGKRFRVTVENIKQVHTTLVEALDSHEGGRFRRDVPLHRTYFHEIAPPDRIAARLTKLVESTADAEFRRSHAVWQAALFHHEFMRIFPFPEISGRVGRLLMNGFLVQGGYLPAVIHASDRQRYYESLRGPVAALRDLIVESMLNAVDCGKRALDEMVTAPVAKRYVN